MLTSVVQQVTYMYILYAQIIFDQYIRLYQCQQLTALYLFLLTVHTGQAVLARSPSARGSWSA